MAEKRRLFGSFHVSNVEDLIGIEESVYSAPKLPKEIPETKVDKSVVREFGKEVKKKYFLLEDDFTFLNHGAFGSVMTPAMNATQAWQLFCERQPVRFIDRQLLSQIADVTRKLAAFINSNPKNVVLVDNVTTAVSSVFSSLELSSEDVVLHTAFIHGGIRSALRRTCCKTGAKSMEIPIHLPVVDEEEIVKTIETSLHETPAKLLIIDHISSVLAFIMPIQKIIDMCRLKGVQILIDGAHGLGSTALDMKALNPDYYTSNCHKWLCGPKGTAFLYVKDEHRQNTHSAVTSYGYGYGFNSEFSWVGTKDYSPFLGLSQTLDFWNIVEPEKIRLYIRDLLRKACNLLIKEWDTDLIAPLNMLAGMALIRLPNELFEGKEMIRYEDAEIIQNCLFNEYEIEVPIKAVNNQLYVRISVHIYNDLHDYEKLATSIMDICKSKTRAL
ncbi:DgyrCDS1928 [Dimorphilus gyrociliatus]|uniref:DgyrCDS1928 n=1 Tax=Dimorphilus gyrociliatus TaxID=2664684 RepID=A0A7I8VBK8_9ANNE|nr:DgyrCDS1928 [Dimorphilus gyrociliatus]